MTPSFQGNHAVNEGSLHLIFVYGTLLRGEHNHHVLGWARFVRPAQTRQEFDLFNLGHYPAMVANGATAVKGELYAVDEEILSRLDRLERHPEFYKRITIQLADTTHAETYLMERELAGAYPRVPSGDWRAKSRGA